MMSQQTDADVRRELDALQRKLSQLEAEYRLLSRNLWSPRPRWAWKLLLGTLCVILLASGGVLYAESIGVGLVIDSSGNVGIGTSAPRELFEVAARKGARAIVSNGGGAERSVILMQAPGSDHVHGRIVAHNYKEDKGLPLILQDTGGNVGIGNGQKPADKLEDTLDVAGSVRVLTGERQNPIRFTSDFSPWTDAPGEPQWTNGATISNDTNDHKTLMIVGNRSNDNETRRVSIYDRLEVNGNAGVTEKLTAKLIEATDQLNAKMLKATEKLEAPNLIRGIVFKVTNIDSSKILDCNPVGLGKCDGSKEAVCDSGSQRFLLSQHYCNVWDVTDGTGYCYTFVCISQ